MNWKNQKGINMITMTIAITILVIITSILVYSSRTGNRIKALNDLYNDIETLNDKVSAYYLKYGDIPKSTIYTNLSFFYETENDQVNPNDGEDYYVIDLNALEDVRLNYGREYDKSAGDVKWSVGDTKEITSLKDIYIINEDSHTIYYPRGIEVEGVIYYTLPNKWAEVDMTNISGGAVVSENYLKLKKGDYVLYKDKNEEYRECVVLYDSQGANYDKYGVQIITSDIVKSDFELGNGTGSNTASNDSTAFSTATGVYTNAISILNSAAEDYLNKDLASSARSVGSLPDKINKKNKTLYSRADSWFSLYNDKYEIGEEALSSSNYESDKTQMELLSINNINKEYWLASRSTSENTESTEFNVNYVNSNGIIGNNSLFYISNDSTGSYSWQCGLRPVFILNTDIQFDIGNGSKSNPYVLK